MPDEPILRQQAREAVKQGKLPPRRPDRVWGGPGVGEICAVCDKRITKDDIEFQIEFGRPARTASTNTTFTSDATPRGSSSAVRSRRSRQRPDHSLEDHRMPPIPTHDEIAECAYFHWLQRGCPIGSPDVDWAAAEAESLARHAPADAGVSAPAAE